MNIPWDDLPDYTAEQLQAIGCQNWDGKLQLFPGSWYLHIPVGMKLVCIDGTTQSFLPYPDGDIRKADPELRARRAYTDNDTRGGYLAWGLVPKQ